MIFNEYTLNELCNIGSSKRIYLSEYVSEGIPFYRGKEIIEKSNCKNISSELFISEERYEEIKNKFKVPNIGDILISAVGTLGKCWYVDEEKFYFKDGNLVWLNDFNTYIINPKFLYYKLTSQWFEIIIDGICIGSTQKALTIEQLKKVTIKIPSIDIQNKVVNILDSINNKLKVNNEINNNLLEQCKSIYKEWFIDYNFVIDGKKYKENNGKMIESENGKIPEGWSFKRIDELDLDISDGNYSSKYPTKQEFKTEGIPFVRGTDFDGYSISRKNLMYITPEKHEILRKGHLKKNDILITTRGEIGRIVFVSDYFIDSNINAQLIRINGDKRFPRSFLGMSLISDYVQNDIQSLVTGTALQQLPVGKFNQVKIIVPNDKKIIESFDSIVEVALRKIQQNEEQNEILEQLRDTLLPKLMNGEIDLDNIEI